jgi:hypothetical protein
MVLGDEYKGGDRSWEIGRGILEGIRGDAAIYY